MCGRYASTRSSVDLSDLFEALDETSLDGASGLEPDYNLAPTDPAPIVRMSASAAGRVLCRARWGLVPPWAADTKGAARMINARAETVATSSAFKPSFERRRCLVPADGWYEWTRVSPQHKQAYFMTPRDGSVLAFAGLWSVWGSGDSRLLSCGIITVDAVADLASVHNRMPLVLPRERWNDWLTSQYVDDLLTPPVPELVAGLEIRPVGAAVGDVRNDGPELVRRIATGPEERVDLTLF